MKGKVDMEAGVCPDKAHTGRNSMMAIGRMVQKWAEEGWIPKGEFLEFSKQFDRLKICTLLFGEESNRLTPRDGD